MADMTEQQQYDLERYIDLIIGAQDKNILAIMESDYYPRYSNTDYYNESNYIITHERYEWMMDYITAHPLPNRDRMMAIVNSDEYRDWQYIVYHYIKDYLGREPILIKPVRRGHEALEYMIAKGAKLLPVWEDSNAKLGTKTNGEWKDNLYIQSRIALDSIMSGRGNAIGMGEEHKFCRFAFSPKSIELICIDIDCNHKDGRNGELEFYKWLDTLWGVRPSYLSNIAAGTYPFYVTTPSGGYHLYFKYRYRGQPLKAKQSLKLLNGKSIEVEVITEDATAPGSYRPATENKLAGDYTLYGNIENALPLPTPLKNAIESSIVTPTHTVSAPTTYRSKNNYNSYRGIGSTYSPPTLDRLLEWTLQYHSGDGHNTLQASFAASVGRKSMKYPNDSTYTIGATLDYIKSRPDVFGTDPDTTGVVKHAYKHGQEHYAATGGK